MELRQWLYNHGDECLWNTGGWIQCDVSVLEGNYASGTPDIYTVNTQKGIASASVTFNGTNINIKAKAKAQIYSYNGRYSRGYAYASANIGTKKHLAINPAKYSMLRVTHDDMDITGCVRTGSMNDQNTNVTTATVLASGSIELSLNIPNCQASIVIGKICGTKTQSFSTTNTSYSYDYNDTITQIYLV